VRLTKPSDAAFKKLAQTDEKGLFTFTSLAKGTYNLYVSYVGFIAQPIAQIVVNDSLVNLGKIQLVRKQTNEAAVVTGTPTVQQKADTIVYNASQFKTNPDATVEDLVKKMPGITIENGVVKAQGEEVKKVTIDGKDFFGDDATAALRNLPADIVDKIQVFDRMSDQAAFTGFDDGNSQKALNIVTKAGLKNGQFGRVFGGYGTQDRYQLGGNVSFFKGNRRISLIGQANNINQQNFSTQDILGVFSNSMGGGRGGFGGGGMVGSRSGMGGGRGGFGGGGTFFVGQQNGINGTNSFGINLNDSWSKKTTISASYFFNNTNTNQNQITREQTFLSDDSSLFLNESSLSKATNFNNRINARLEYKIDSFNSIIISPNASFQNNENQSSLTSNSNYSSGFKVNEQNNNSNRKNFGYNLGSNILWRHAFKAKRGRTISIGVNTTWNNRDGETTTVNNNINYRLFGIKKDSVNQFVDLDSRNYSVGASINYTEPISNNGQLQISYAPNISNNNNNQEAYKFDYGAKQYSVFDQNLSNKFDNKYITNNGSITYRKGNRESGYSIGVAAQSSSLNSDQTYPLTLQVRRNFFNLLPEARWEKKVSKRSSLRFNYRSNTNAPSISQLQNVFNNSNPLAISTGNPDLKQSFSQNLSARYTFTNTGKSQSLFLNVFAQRTDNYISNATYIFNKDSVLNPSIILYRGSQLSKPVNVNGFYSLRSFATFGQMLKGLKANLNANAAFSFNNIPGIVNSATNKSQAYSYSLGATLSSNVSQYIDYTLSYNANLNNVVNTLQPQLNSKYYTYTTNAQVNLLSKNGWFFQTDVTNQSYKGLSDGFNQHFLLWNMGVGKKFLKEQKGELKLSVFDLLKQNQSIQRNITERGISDVQNVVLTQYFIMTFTYKLKNFGKAPVQNNNSENRREEWRDRMRMGGGMPGF
jgi:hypothetical protein